MAVLCVELAQCQPWAGGGSPTCLVLLAQGLWPRPVWRVLQLSAGEDLCPWNLALLLRSGETSEVVGLWHPWHTLLLALLAFAVTPGQENGAAPGLGTILLMVVTMLCCCILASA